MMAVTTGIATGRMAVAIRPWSGRVGSGQTGYALAISLDCEVIADNESALEDITEPSPWRLLKGVEADDRAGQHRQGVEAFGGTLIANP